MAVVQAVEPKGWTAVVDGRTYGKRVHMIVCLAFTDNVILVVYMYNKWCHNLNSLVRKAAADENTTAL